jgi:hypothetical protein
VGLFCARIPIDPYVSTYCGAAAPVPHSNDQDS